jgi:hypothetical protein
MSFYASRRAGSRFRLVLSSFGQHEGLRFASVLPEETIQNAFADADVDFAQDEDDIYTPALTLWAFLSQVLHTGTMRSCAAAVARVVVLMVAMGKFPLIRMVVLLSLATAMVQDMALGPYQGKETGETALLRELFGQLHAGDILVADRYFCSYFMIASALVLGVDFVARMHQCRDYDFQRGRRLGRGDHVVQWLKPQRPTWMDHVRHES